MIVEKLFGDLLDINPFVKKDNEFLKFEQNKSCVMMKPSVDREKPTEDLIKQITKKVIPVFEKCYPKIIVVFAFDNATSHGAYAEDALTTTKMNLKMGGKGKFKSGIMLNRTIQSIHLPDGRTKGIRLILEKHKFSYTFTSTDFIAQKSLIKEVIENRIGPQRFMNVYRKGLTANGATPKSSVPILNPINLDGSYNPDEFYNPNFDILMPCYADTIVRVKFVKQYEKEKESSNFLVVWALGTYPVERDDQRDNETQAIFEKDGFYSVGGKIIPGFYNGNKRAKVLVANMTVSTSTHLTILNKVVESNKCPLKVSLVGIPQEIPTEVEDDTVINTLVTDYSGQEYNFIMKVVFSCHNLRMASLKNIVRPQESLIFVVGQLEIIENEFYVYAKDVNCIDTRFVNKKRFFESNVPRDVLASRNSAHTKLLVTHQNIGNLEKKSKSETLVDSNNFENTTELNLMDRLHDVKHVRIDESLDKDLVSSEHLNSEFHTKESNELVSCNTEEGSTKVDKDGKKVSRGKGKGPVERSLRNRKVCVDQMQ
ncbi:hypothetical protein Glove_97g74 [Diversispora epigaea]|uniref:Uncharacterized protein n=1 Tax=Diversispora epigaea TaxID=1348612 RepID=A0A397J5J3_9GLOM|nr:hypothetical protein Glove_97g74 [Diversispora epigaea]